MFVRSFSSLAIAAVAAFGLSAHAAHAERHQLASLESSATSHNCILGLKSGQVYCPQNITNSDPSLDLTALPLIEDVDEEWRELSVSETARILTRRSSSEESTSKISPKRDSDIGGTNNMAMVCLYDKGLTDDCAKNWGYYCNSNGQLYTSKKDREEGCEHCECIDLNPKPNCILGLAGNLYCGRDTHDDDPSDSEADGIVVETLPTSVAQEFQADGMVWWKRCFRMTPVL